MSNPEEQPAGIASEHPDPLLQRFILLDIRDKRIRAAEVLTKSITLGELLGGNPAVQLHLVVDRRIEELRHDFKEEMGRLATELAFQIAGEEVRTSPTARQHLEDQLKRSKLDTVDKLAVLAHLHESLSLPSEIWAGDRPWVGR